MRLLPRSGGPDLVGIGLLLLGLAAAFGVAAALGLPDASVAAWGVRRLALQVGVPMVGVGFSTATFMPQHAVAARRYGFVLLLVAGVAFINVPVWGLAVAGIGLALIALSAFATLPRDPLAGGFGLAGALMLLASAVWLQDMAWLQLGVTAGVVALGVAAGRYRVWIQAPLDQR